MNFEEAENWLYSFQKHGMKLGLERITYITEKLGKTQKKYKTIHVGGTNGKGSVCKLLESILDNSGYVVGVYTSPHLQRINERITVNKKEITKQELINLVEKVKPIVEEMKNLQDTPTFFEVFSFLAIWGASIKDLKYNIWYYRFNI